MLIRGLSVRRKLIYTVLLVMLLSSLNGCGGMLGKWPPHEDSERRRNLAAAVNLIGAGHQNEAGHFLELVIDDSREDGVTDEALFRLAILKLNDGEPGEGRSSIALLDRLRNGYPASVWTSQSEPLYSYLIVVKNIRNGQTELKTMREKNFSLSRDVTELRQTIERLKALDRELEQKIRH